MRLFVSEYVCSGAWPEARLPASLAREGRAMLTAFADDCSRIPGYDVVITWDAPRFGAWEHAGVRAVEIANPGDEWRQFDTLSAECDATCVIAPELDNLLAMRCRAVLDAGGRLLNAAPEAIELCSDKLLLAAELGRIGVATIPTKPFVPSTPAMQSASTVVKPRFGAGSQSIFGLGSLDSWQALRTIFADEPVTRQGIVQPWIAGDAISAAALFGPDGDCRNVFPIAEQVLSLDQRFRYLGGRIPYLGGRISSSAPCHTEIAEMIRRAGAAIGGLRGYIGFDFIFTGNELLLVEINPRLTTSYIGYRELATANLAAWIVSRHSEPVEPGWRPGVVEFSCDGRLIRRPGGSEGNTEERPACA